jgi:hypothetical protein
MEISVQEYSYLHKYQSDNSLSFGCFRYWRFRLVKLKNLAKSKYFRAFWKISNSLESADQSYISVESVKMIATMLPTNLSLKTFGNGLPLRYGFLACR